MIGRQPTSPILKVIAGAAVTMLLLVSLTGNLDGRAALWSNLLGKPLWQTLGIVFSVAPAAVEALQAYAFRYQQIAPCPLEMLACFWPLFHAVAEVA
jgi:hypothetical protein